MTYPEIWQLIAPNATVLFVAVVGLIGVLAGLAAHFRVRRLLDLNTALESMSQSSVQRLALKKARDRVAEGVALAELMPNSIRRLSAVAYSLSGLGLLIGLLGLTGMGLVEIAAPGHGVDAFAPLAIYFAGLITLIIGFPCQILAMVRTSKFNKAERRILRLPPA